MLRCFFDVVLGRGGVSYGVTDAEIRGLVTFNCGRHEIFQAGLWCGGFIPSGTILFLGSLACGSVVSDVAPLAMALFISDFSRF
ncbi:hypothetical protein L484_008235 [Morus notabilis]|uniref:Uncharacterized protein n=1 Tax=Morus notabilis TaxID=981085 RepID=W9SK05_9ROSA|nr:hypothetical protein L484_008235 [Morus notabilis]